MKNCLFITKHNPFGTGGGAYASNEYLKLFSKIFEHIDLCMAKECVLETPIGYVDRILGVGERSFIKKLIQLPQFIFHRYYEFVFKMDLSKYQYAVLDHSAVSSTFVRKFNKKSIYTITIHHNVEKEYFLTNSRSIFKYFAVIFIQANERKAYKNSCLNLFLTQYDKNYFERKYGKTRGQNYVSSFFFDEKKFFVQNDNEKQYDFVISCSLSSNQNKKMLVNFILRYIEEIEKYKLLITGKDPDKELLQFLSKYSNITVIKNPDNIQSIVNQAKIYLCPIEDGGGIKIRCFDAIAQLMPVILHKNALRGYEILEEKGFFYTYEDKVTFRDAINNILESYNYLQTQKDLYKAQAIENYSLTIKMENLIQIINTHK